MKANYVQRLRLSFTKDGPARYIGHLDLARTLERSLNRARIPVARTQGFNKRPRMALAAALPLGYTSRHELADIWMSQAMEPDIVQQQLSLRMAPGISVWAIKETPIGAPALQTMTRAASYEVRLSDEIDRADLETRVEKLLQAQSVIRERRQGRKSKVRRYDLRPLIEELALSEQDGDGRVFEMRLTLREGRSGRPDEVLKALDLDPFAAVICRTRIYLDES